MGELRAIGNQNCAHSAVSQIAHLCQEVLRLPLANTPLPLSGKQLYARSHKKNKAQYRISFLYKQPLWECEVALQCAQPGKRGQCRWLHHSYNGRARVLCYFTTLTPCARPLIAGFTFFFRNSRKKSEKRTNLLSGGSSSNSKDLKHQVGTSALERSAGGVIASHAKALHKTRHSAPPPPVSLVTNKHPCSLPRPGQGHLGYKVTLRSAWDTADSKKTLNI